MISPALLPARSKFLGQLLSRQGQLEALRCAINEDRGPREALREISEITHRMSGVAATLGFARLGRLSAELDRQITAALDEDRDIGRLWLSAEPLLEDLMDEMDLGLAA